MVECVEVTIPGKVNACDNRVACMLERLSSLSSERSVVPASLIPDPEHDGSKTMASISLCLAGSTLRKSELTTFTLGACFLTVLIRVLHLLPSRSMARTGA